VTGSGLIEAGYGIGATTSAAIGFGFFGPVGAVGAFVAFSFGFGGSLGAQLFARNRF
jgi:hypothetical protein